MQIELVSGMAGEVRRLTGRELHQIADPAMVRSGGSVDLMLKSCFLAITEPGPYPWQPGEKPKWDDALTGDRFDALLQLRAATFGNVYDFSVQCSAPSGTCRERYDWELRYTDLPRRLLSEAATEKLRAGENDFATVAGGKAVRFRLGTGKDEKLAAKLRHQQRGAWSPIDAIAMRLLEVEGLKTQHDKFWRKWLLDDLAWPEVLDLLDAMDAQDCGIDTKIETECPFCGWVQEVQLPFGVDFFRPRKRKKATEETETDPTTTTPAAAAHGPTSTHGTRSTHEAPAAGGPAIAAPSEGSQSSPIFGAPAGGHATTPARSTTR